ncbi:hypothetical protein [Euzebya sp.]|uniref:hypothetical protein n=1 Tax=Euzebya sp. TaxID=1971409 RepID=UPI003513936F
MTRLRAFGRWLADWRTGVGFAAVLVAGGFLALVIGLLASRQEAFDRLDQALGQLEVELEREEQLQGRVTDLSAEVATLTEQVRVLVQQLEDAGIVPLLIPPVDPPPVGEPATPDGEATSSRDPPPPAAPPGSEPGPAPAPDPVPPAPPPPQPADPPGEPTPDPPAGAVGELLDGAGDLGDDTLDDVGDTTCTLTDILC